jgi:hypothetical protein
MKRRITSLAWSDDVTNLVLVESGSYRVGRGQCDSQATRFTPRNELCDPQQILGSLHQVGGESGVCDTRQRGRRKFPGGCEDHSGVITAKTSLDGLHRSREHWRASPRPSFNVLQNRRAEPDLYLYCGQAPCANASISLRSSSSRRYLPSVASWRA